MTITLLLLMLAGQVTTAPAAPAEAERPAVDTAKSCHAGPHLATVLRKNVRPQRLDELPPGRLELTVMRGIGECLRPVVLREGIGGRR